MSVKVYCNNKIIWLSQNYLMFEFYITIFGIIADENIKLSSDLQEVMNDITRASGGMNFDICKKILSKTDRELLLFLIKKTIATIKNDNPNMIERDKNNLDEFLMEINKWLSVQK